mgnify:CR=1 FL=1
MAKPFFSGNYGSALARVDTRPITEAGKAQGQSFQAIGGMIKEYGLNKEKRQKEEDAAMGNLMGLSPESLSQLKSRNPKIEGAVDKLINGTGGKREVDLINSSVAPFIAGQARDDKSKTMDILNKQNELNLSINKELKDTQIQLGKDRGIISDINVKVAEMKKRGLTKEEANLLKRLKLTGEKIDAESDNLSYKTDAEMNAALLSSATSKTNIGLVEPRAEATKAALETSVMTSEQKQSLMPGDTSLAIKKQELDSKKIDGENFFIDAFGGAEEKSKFDYQGQILSRNNFNKGLEYLDAKINYTKFLSTAKNVPVDTKKKYASLVSHSGKILDTRVEDPDTGNPITFEKYMEKANDGDERYPLTGDGSGAAGTLYGNYLSAQKQINDFGKTIQVQVDDGLGAGGSPAPTRSTMPFSQMPPEQAMQALQDRIGELRRLGPSINAQRQQVGQPGQNMPTPQAPMGGGGFTLGSNQAPQSINYIQQQGDALTQQEAQRKSDLAAAEAQLLELQSQFGVR